MDSTSSRDDQANTLLERSSSPNHEFSFTICLHETNRASSPIALDLSPADDIFFHGHLLPLHLISHLPRRPSTDNHNSSSPPLHHTHTHTDTTESKPTNKPFSLFGLNKWRKGLQDRNEAKRKLRHLIKRYVRPLALFKKERVKSPPFSFSSAPASMRTSPTNSGPLLGDCSKTADSTMEELQAAIQAAIAHCKNSIATQDKRKCNV